MTGPQGDRHRGWWHIVAVDPPRVEPVGQRSTRMTVTSTFASVEAMEQLVAMGMEEGMSLAVGQIDDILASLPVT